MRKKYSLGMMLTLMLIASALTCVVTVFVITHSNKVPDGILGAGQNFTDLLALIDEVFIGEFDVDDTSTAAMRAAVEALGDRWSFYLTPEEYARHLDRLGNRYAGIGVGVSVDEETGGIRVLHVFKGSAAETAGIVAGDMIVGVGGEYTYGITIDELRDLIARPIGDSVELTIIRADGAEQTVTVVYSFVFVDPVSYEMLDGDIGYIRLENFDTGSADRFIFAARVLIEQGARAFVFDVRANSGGRVNEMTKILDFLLPEGEIFIIVDRAGNEEVTLSDANMVDLPAVVMVDRESFSAAEYFAATLREYGYAEIVGERTTGKSRMQVTIELPSGSALHISTAQYLTPNRVSLHDAGGLTPDYQVALTQAEQILFFEGNLEKEHDPQLQKALSILQSATTNA
jgi:carboxyl-terminal processing protease